MTFGTNLPSFEPETLSNLVTDPTVNVTNIIAPFWADVDTRGPLSGLVTYGTNMVDGHAAFGVTWPCVGYFASKDDKTNTFQLVLINRPDRADGDYDVEFNYAQIQWDEGEATTGVSGDGLSSPDTDPARAGFASLINETNIPSFELNGSGISRALLDTNLVTGLIHHNLNSTVPGRYIFQFHDGTNGVPPGTP